MTIEEIVAFIQEGERQGKQKYAIRQELLSSGVATEMIDAGMSAARGETSVPSEQPVAAAAPNPGAPAPAVIVTTRAAGSSPRAAGGVPRWLFPVLGVVLLFTYFATYHRYYGPNWTVQYLIVLLTWGWVWRNRGQMGMLGGILTAALTAVSIFSAGLRLMTFSFGIALLYAIFGGRWQEGGAKAFIVVTNVVLLLWFLAGLANPEVRNSMI